MNHKKIKAIFEIFIVISAVFTIYLINDTKSVEAANQACCEKLRGSNDYCIFTDEAQCDNNRLNQVGTICENTEFCAIGTCYNTNTGECSSQVSKAKCIADGGSFDARPIDEVPICNQGCCVTPNGCSISTKNQCKVALQSYSQIPLDNAFKGDISDETQCNNICASAEVGCFVPNDPSTQSCKFGFRSEVIGQDGNFRTGVYCSNVQECECTKEYQKSCLNSQQQQYFNDDDNVHWFDSCGNPEQVVGSSYTGYVDDVRLKSNCNENSNNVNNPECGLCNVIDGSVCGKKEVNFKENYQCVSLDCGTGHGDSFKWVEDRNSKTGWKWDSNGNDNFNIKNYDSWCYYESIVGQGRDLVGTRHHLFRCKDGEIIPEPGKINRENICVMSFNNGKPSARLIINDAFSCVQANSDDASCGGECAGINKEYDKILCCNEQRCENNENECYWDENVQRCAPQVSAGTLGTDSELNKAGDQECIAVYQYSFWRTSGDHWDCIANCDCVDKANDFNNYCKSLGDFGVYYNFIGKLGEGGYTFTKDVSKSGINAPTPVNPNSVKYVENPETFISGDSSLIYELWYDVFIGERNVKLGETPEYKGIFGRKYGISVVPLAYLGVQYLINKLIIKFAIKKAVEALSKGATKKAIERATAKAAERTTGKKTVEEFLKKQLGEVLGKKTAGLLISALNIAMWVWLAIEVFNFVMQLVNPPKIVHYKFTCDPWLAPSGNQNCELCQNDPNNPFAICDEYRCSSLGAKCDFIGKNPDGSDAETGLCKLKKERDLTAPIITPLQVEPNRRIQPIGTEGYNIQGEFDRKNSIVIGVKTDELAACKIHKVRETSYDNMIFFNNEKWQTNHTVELFFTGEDPGQDSLLMFGSGEKMYYVSCKDPDDNIRPNYKIQFKVREGPDITKPVIIKIDPKSNAYIPYTQESTNLYLLVEDESGVSCKYSRTPNKNYDEMEGSFICSSSSIRDPEGLIGYKCVTRLTGLRSNQDNIFYFRCKDNAENVNEQDQPSGGYVLKGSNPLILESAGPEGKLYTRDITLTATTKNGATGDGKSECRYYLSITRESDKAFNDMFKFLNTNANTHSHQLVNLENGDYYTQIMCRDVGGNDARKQITFNIDTPNLTITNFEPLNNSKIYQIPFNLKVTTIKGYNNNGDSTCSYKYKLLPQGNYGESIQIIDKEIQESMTIHNRDISLGDGKYVFEITCRDSVGKSDKTYINLEINKENVPELRRVYTEGNLLSIEISEPSECKYSDRNFNYETEGNPMVSSDEGYKHQATLQDVFYIICENINNGNRNSQPFIIYP